MKMNKVLVAMLVVFLITALCSCGEQKNDTVQENDKKAEEMLPGIEKPAGDVEYLEPEPAVEVLVPEDPPEKEIIKPAELEFHVYTDYEECFQKGCATAYDSEGEAIWFYATLECPLTELEGVQYIGEYNDGYYILANGEIIYLNYEGREKWVNGDFHGASCHWNFDGEGNLYLCGYYGPDLFKIDREGNTVYCVDSYSAEENDFWPCNLVLRNGVIEITFEMSENTIYVDPATGELINAE